MAPPPDAVAALAEALLDYLSGGDHEYVSEGRTGSDAAEYDAGALLERLSDTGWSLVRTEERRSAVIGSERSDNEALVAALDDILELLVYTSVSTVVVDRAHDIAAKARAAIEGRP